MPTSLSALSERLQQTLWFIPALFAVGAVVGATVMLALDRQVQTADSAFFVYGGTPEGARGMLSTIAQSMLTFTGLVFTVTMLVLQLASSQLSPRVLRTFLSDRQNQVVLGLFVATFIYTLVVLREVQGGGPGEEFVPGLSIWASFVLLLGSVGAFVYYINHMAHAIRASTVIANIAADTMDAINKQYPQEADSDRSNDSADGHAMPERDASWRSVDADKSGFLLDLDDEALLKFARRLDLLVEIVPRVGDFVTRSAPVAFVNAEPASEAAEDLRGAVSIGDERTMRRDPAFGFRQLVDVGLRTLSPSTNDPTTASHVVDRLHGLLLTLSTRPFPAPFRSDEDGVVRLRLNPTTWADYVQLATEEFQIYGRGHPQVMAALRAMLDSLAKSVPEARRQPVFAALNQMPDGLGAGSGGAEASEVR